MKTIRIGAEFNFDCLNTGLHSIQSAANKLEMCIIKLEESQSTLNIAYQMKNTRRLMKDLEYQVEHLKSYKHSVLDTFHDLDRTTSSIKEPVDVVDLKNSRYTSFNKWIQTTKVQTLIDYASYLGLSFKFNAEKVTASFKEEVYKRIGNQASGDFLADVNMYLSGLPDGPLVRGKISYSGDCITYSLSRDDFVSVKSEEGNYYGGDQGWYSRYTQRNGGCGPTAAANILAYMALTDPRFVELYGEKNYSKKSYSAFMEDVYEFVKPFEVYNAKTKNDLIKYKLIFDEDFNRSIPSTLGISSLEKFSTCVEDYAESIGSDLKAVWSKDEPTFENAVEYIKSGLIKDRPVALLNMWDGVPMNYKDHITGENHSTNYERHWVTITGLTENQETGEVTLEVSTWGNKGTINFNELWDGDLSSYFFPEGIMYFD